MFSTVSSHFSSFENLWIDLSFSCQNPPTESPYLTQLRHLVYMIESSSDYSDATQYFMFQVLVPRPILNFKQQKQHD